MAGSLKVIYTQWCTRHSLSSIKHKLGDIEQITPIQQHSVPFGIEALKSGIEVEGVWISQPSSQSNSPPLSQGSPRCTPDQTTAIRSVSAIDVSISPKSIHPAMRRLSDESRRSRRTRQEPVTYAIKSTKPQLLQDLDAVYRTPRWFREESLSSSIDDVTSTRPATPPKSPKRLAKQKAEAEHTRQRSVDFSMIDRNRQAQAAETGQLKARAPRHLSVDVSGKPRAQSQQPLPRSATLPIISVSPESPARATNLPEVVPFAQFCQSTPPSPTYTFTAKEQREISDILDYASCTDIVSPITPAIAPPIGIAVSTPAEIVIMPENESGPFELEDTSPRRPSFEKVNSIRDQVVRGHDSGFEILKPGSLSEKTRPESSRHQSGPPISLHNWTRGREESTNRGRKLQKRRQASVDSQASVRSASSNRSRLSLMSGLFARS